MGGGVKNMGRGSLFAFGELKGLYAFFLGDPPCRYVKYVLPPVKVRKSLSKKINKFCKL